MIAQGNCSSHRMIPMHGIAGLMNQLAMINHEVQGCSGCSPESMEISESNMEV